MADRIPPELFEALLTRIRNDHQDGMEDRFNIRELGVCSLTCRYWATHIRPLIFKELVLGSREDALTFIRFAESTVVQPTLASCVRHLVLKQSIPCAPWIHLITHCMSRALLPGTLQVQYSVKGASSTPAVAPKSVYHDLPRTLPLPPMLISNAFSFEHLQLNRVQDLFRLVDSMVHRQSLTSFSVFQLSDLSWLDGYALAPTQAIAEMARRQRNCTMPRREYDATLSRCPPFWPFLLLVSSTKSPTIRDQAGFRRFIERTELSRICAVLQDLVDNCSCSRCSLLKEGNDRRRIKFSSLGNYGNFSVSVLDSDQSGPSNDAGIHTLNIHVSKDGSVTSILYRLENALALESSTKIDWGSLDRHAAGFTQRLTSVIVWSPYTEAQTESLAVTIGTRMPAMNGAGTLSVEVLDPKTRRWKKCRTVAPEEEGDLAGDVSAGHVTDTPVA